MPSRRGSITLVGDTNGTQVLADGVDSSWISLLALLNPYANFLKYSFKVSTKIHGCTLQLHTFIPWNLKGGQLLPSMLFIVLKALILLHIAVSMLCLQHSKIAPWIVSKCVKEVPDEMLVRARRRVNSCRARAPRFATTCVQTHVCFCASAVG